MAFNWEKFIVLAEELKNAEDSDGHFYRAKLRTSVSRAYYGAFHKARLRLGYTDRNSPSHKEVIDKLRENEEIDENERLSSILDNLKRDRQKADYRAHEEIDNRFVTTFWYRLDEYLELWEQNES